MTARGALPARLGAVRELLRVAWLPWCIAAVLAGLEMGALVSRAPSGTPPRLFYAATLEVLGGAAIAVAFVELARRALRLPNGADASPDAEAESDSARLAHWALFGVLAPISIYLASEWLRLLARALHNRELATLLGAIGVLGLGAMAQRVYLLNRTRLARTLATRRTRSRPLVLVPGSIVTLLVMAWALGSSGLDQLEPALIAPTVLLIAHYGLAKNSELAKTPRLFRRFVLFTTAAGLALALLGGALSPSAASALARHGAWSRPIVGGLRQLTDFDADGSSAWFGGGDCAAFDAAVHPGAREVPGDGIDNNCRAGDGVGKKQSAFTAPRASQLVPASVPRRANLVLVTVETLRADHVSWLGYRRKTTPELDQLAQTSFVFHGSYAPTPTTRLSLTGLLSGRQPGAVRWIPQADARQMRKIAPETPWLPQILRERGYLTLAVHTDFRAFTEVESAGFERGFERYDTSTKLDYVGGTMRGFPGQAQVDRALSLLDELAHRPFFLWLHLVEPHYTYERSSAAPDFGDDEVALYDADIAEASRQVGRLLRGLMARGLVESSIVLVAGDHGEEFGEHGQRFHGSNLYEAQVRTPSLLHVPGLPRRDIADAVSLVDFAPTLLDLLGVHDAFAAMTGRNLLAALLGQGALKPGIILENFRVNNGAEPLFARVELPLKLIFDPSRAEHELYDLARDPGERKNLYSADDPLAARLAAELYGYIENDAAPSERSR